MTDTQRSQPSGTSPKAPDRRPTLGSKPAFWPTVILASASFLLLFEFLAFQLSHGKDPAVGSSPSAVAAKPPRPILIRRVVDTRVVTDAGSRPAGTTVSSGTASSGSSAASAAAETAPAPAPAPAAPVVSSSS